MPTYHTPPDTPTSSSPPLRSPSSSRSDPDSQPAAPKRRPLSHKKEDDVDTRPESILKTSLLFLGSVAAATFCAHKYWPKGITYGEREAWELEKEVKKAKRNLQNEKAQARRDDRSRRSSSADRQERRARYRGESSREYGVSAGGGYMTREEVYRERDRSRGATSLSTESSRQRHRESGRGSSQGNSREGSRQGSRQGSRHRQFDAYDQGSTRRNISRDRDRDRIDAVMIEERRNLREQSYYPPAPKRYVGEGSSPAPRSRRTSVERSRPRSYYEEDGLFEPVYVSRDPQLRRTRPVSVHGAGRRRYDDEVYER